MQGHPLLKDLATDFDDFFEKHMSVQPRLYRIDAKEQYAAKKEYHQTREEVDRFLPYSYCIMCGLCEDACPRVNTNPNFKGPQALAKEYRYYADSRDQLGKKRLLDADRLDGVWGCEFAGACSKVCPKGVDPAAAIQLLKTELMSNTTAEEREPARHST
jgi:succinate dehydrogenase / fumarate reductase iron-sulfur subunit